MRTPCSVLRILRNTPDFESSNAYSVFRIPYSEEESADAIDARWAAVCECIVRKRRCKSCAHVLSYRFVSLVV